MSLASSSYSYPILGAFWTVLMIFLWVIWFWILITHRKMMKIVQNAPSIG